MKKKCSIQNCTSNKRSWGLCKKHLMQAMREGLINYEPCSIEGCSEPKLAKSYCDKHYKRVRTYGDPNIVRKGGKRPWKIYSSRQDLLIEHKLNSYELTELGINSSAI